MQITGSVGFHEETLPQPDVEQSKLKRRIRKVMNNCMRRDPSERPSFHHIISYLEKIGSKEPQNVVVST